ncbi:UDP-2,4-diacetamido-2,4,6-trideoxy-beta-L-altropyranose hydrolase [Pseudodesulfovibrio sp. F-1]|uniref:UDP-2,4-diacetamido-2,4, 6-trideoxy-beta-L-altropyranose hydrolase n=1 Tax=Pseudodesulfovibrio alkaliphilus TaxID=2661613 RepID=A0A7K1KLR3_9BACT|nr:UDP-2,4-diacetamido-2,4,6-trideoxy-beta-L-altropyranose hydrolase [Pseudodesulfovibrio alkaliphilus]MUM76957.1 UDP-2,4-diacetamido-2,4,6-trideoxy-beta-L-altropyranose hydrolase [Pseudodesulfovibrio alkaliphilus]
MIGTLTIRADSSPSMGTGHVMRMIALGQAWQDRGGRVRLIGSVGALEDRIRAEGFDFIAPNAPHPAPDDLALVSAHMRKGDWLAIDGYHFDSAYQQALIGAGFRTLVMDDICDRAPYFATALLNQNHGADAYQYEINADAALLLGTRFTLLRREFRTTGPVKSPAPQKAWNILVTLGGADPGNLTSAVLAAMASLKDDSLRVKVVAGAANPHLDRLRGDMTTLPCPTELLTDVRDMPGLMAWADLAVTAAGSTCWELCRMGVPMLALQAANNQESVCTGLNGIGAAICLDTNRALENIVSRLTMLMNAPDRRQVMSEAGMRAIDGCGALRVADHLYCTGLRLRPATQDDCQRTLDWRNRPDIRAQSFSNDRIAPKDHARWFAGKLNEPSCHLFIAEDDQGTPVGQFRFDLDGDEALVSLSTAPDRTGRGIGTAMTRLACQWLARNVPSARAVARVKPDNAASLSMFAKVGFRLVKTIWDERGEYHRLEL